MKSRRPAPGAPGGAFDSDDGTDLSVKGIAAGMTEEHDAAFRPGTLLEDRYRVESLLGEGGMAYVYRARDERYGRPVALKVMRLTVMGHIARFEREARATAALTHPSVVHIYEYGQLPDNRPFLVLEYVEGDTLIDWLDERGAIQPVLAVGMIAPVVGALVEAHDVGIVHRDIKADNLIIQRVLGQGAALRLLDFSIAAVEEPKGKNGRRLTATGQLFGTPEYMAPEQAEGKRATAAADIWSIGVVLRLMVTNELPFEGRNTPEILYRLVNEPPPPMPESVPADIRAIIDACLSRKPEDRPTAVGLLNRLEQILLSEQKTFHGGGVRVGYTPPPEISAVFSPLGNPELSTSATAFGEEADVFKPSVEPEGEVEITPKSQRSSMSMLMAGLAVGFVISAGVVMALSAAGSFTPDVADADIATVSFNATGRDGTESFGVVPVAEELIELDHGTAALAWLNEHPASGEDSMRRRLARALAQINALKANVGLAGLGKLLDEEIRLWRDQRVMPALIKALDFKRSHPKAMEILAKGLNGPEAVRVERALLETAANGRQKTRWRVIEVFRKAGRDVRTVTLTSLRADLRMKSCRAQQKAVDKLDKLGDSSVLPDLRSLAEQGGGCFRSGYLEAIIGRLGG
ncbi:MAG: serine/threonine-protein kinase [Bradymonadia bacterium]